MREDIIARLYAVVRGVTSLRTTARNQIAFDDTQLPAGSVLEGDEDVSDDSERTRPSNRPNKVTATPQVFLRVGVGSGSEMNELIEEVKAAVLGDAELAAMTLNGHGIRYMAMQSTLNLGRWSDMAACALTFGITYIDQ